MSICVVWTLTAFRLSGELSLAELSGWRYLLDVYGTPVLAAGMASGSVARSLKPGQR